MSVPHRVRGVKVLKAVSSPVRLQILNWLSDKGRLSYTELMGSLKMNPGSDAGRFAYHLKSLLKADLIDVDVEAKKYFLTELGKMVIDIADKVEKKASKSKGMLVRTSRFTMEEFDANRIAGSLIKEARMPAELAQRIAKETEKQLARSKIKYATAPLIREVVNATLIEKGLEEYRHKLTRLGLPVHDVTALTEGKSGLLGRSSAIGEKAGESVLKEHMLLNVLSRDIADAHLSGSLHIDGLSSWILRPSEVMHDLRFFLQKGLDLEKVDAVQSSVPPPQNLESSLSMIFNALVHTSGEVVKTQTLDYFNIFLAPYMKGMELNRIKEALHLFVTSVNQHVGISLGLELAVPDFIGDRPAPGPSGKSQGQYSAFIDESQLLASLLLDVLAEESAVKPLPSLKTIVKIRPETFVNERAKALLLKAHALASGNGYVYFANLFGQDQRQAVFSASGCKLGTDLNGDWEIDTLRTGCLGCVTINMPRIAYDSGRDKAKFLQILRERLEMALRALDIKNRALKQHAKRLLPFLVQSTNGDRYFRLENCSWTISFAGCEEAVGTLSGKSTLGDEMTLKLVQDIVQEILGFTRKTGRRGGRRLLPALLPTFEASKRLAELDIERFGVGKARFSGTRERPFYSAARKLAIQGGKISETTGIGTKLLELCQSGGLTIIELGEGNRSPDELVTFSKQIAEEGMAELFTYNRASVYCISCRKSWFGLLHKCPSCGATGTLTVFDRFALSK